MTTPKFSRFDTSKASGVHVTFERLLIDDPDSSPADYLFQDEDYREQDQARLDAFHAGEWNMLGVRAVAHVQIVRDGHGTMFSIESPGVWGVESDSGDEYLNSLYEEEKAELMANLKTLGQWSITN